MLDKILGTRDLWQILFPITFIGILIGAYKSLKKAKMINPNDEEPDEFSL
jgi:hypothetical protein